MRIWPQRTRQSALYQSCTLVHRAWERPFSSSQAIHPRLPYYGARQSGAWPRSRRHASYVKGRVCSRAGVCEARDAFTSFWEAERSERQMCPRKVPSALKQAFSCKWTSFGSLDSRSNPRRSHLRHSCWLRKVLPMDFRADKYGPYTLMSRRFLHHDPQVLLP